MPDLPPEMIAEFDRVHAGIDVRIDALIVAYRKGVVQGHTDTEVSLGIVKSLKIQIDKQVETPGGAQTMLLYMLVEAVRKLAARPWETAQHDWSTDEL